VGNHNENQDVFQKIGKDAEKKTCKKKENSA